MQTNRSLRTIAVIILIVIVSASLTACQGDGARETLNFVAQAAYSDNSAATWASFNSSPRVANCDISSKQLLRNAINSETNPEIGIGSWLDGKMSSFSCITPAQ